jgi:hypothetical protein
VTSARLPIIPVTTISWSSCLLRELFTGAAMVSVSGKITDDFLAKLKAGSDVRPDQITKLEKLLKQEKAPKVEDLIAVFNLDPPPAKVTDGEVK